MKKIIKYFLFIYLFFIWINQSLAVCSNPVNTTYNNITYSVCDTAVYSSTWAILYTFSATNYYIYNNRYLVHSNNSSWNLNIRDLSTNTSIYNWNFYRNICNASWTNCSSFWMTAWTNIQSVLTSNNEIYLYVTYNTYYYDAGNNIPITVYRYYKLTSISPYITYIWDTWAYNFNNKFTNWQIVNTNLICHTDIFNYPYRLSQKYNSWSILNDFNLDTTNWIWEIDYRPNPSLNNVNIKLLNAKWIIDFSTWTFLDDTKSIKFTWYNLAFWSELLSSYLYWINKSKPIIKITSDYWIDYINIKWVLIWETYNIFQCNNNNIISQNLSTNTTHTFNSINELCIEFWQWFFLTNYLLDLDFWSRETQFLNTQICTSPNWDTYVDWELFFWDITDPGWAKPNTTFIDTLNNNSIICSSWDIECSINKYSISSWSLLENNLDQINTTWSWFINITPWSTLNNLLTTSWTTDKCDLINTNTMTFNYYSNWNVWINFTLQNLPLLDNSVWQIADKLTWVFIWPINWLIWIVSLIIPFTQETKDYCLFWQIITIEQHKLFTWTPDYQKMNFFDYLVLFWLSLFLYYKFIRKPLIPHPYTNVISLKQEINNFKRNQELDKQYYNAFWKNRR